jgi:hypothetical protein
MAWNPAAASTTPVPHRNRTFAIRCAAFSLGNNFSVANIFLSSINKLVSWRTNPVRDQTIKDVAGLGKRRGAGGTASGTTEQIRGRRARSKICGDAWTRIVPGEHCRRRDQPFCVQAALREVPGRRVMRRDNGLFAGLYRRRSRAQLQREERCAHA